MNPTDAAQVSKQPSLSRNHRPVWMTCLVAASSLLLTSFALAKPSTHPGFGSGRDTGSNVSPGEGVRAQRHKLRARPLRASPWRNEGKKIRVCKESHSEFVCSTRIVY
jgi:hypothetical protein